MKSPRKQNKILYSMAKHTRYIRNLKKIKKINNIRYKVMKKYESYSNDISSSYYDS